MALIPAHNTLGFGFTETCERPRRGQPFCQLVERGDITSFQVNAICEGAWVKINNGIEKIATESQFNTFYQTYLQGEVNMFTFDATEADDHGDTGSAKGIAPTGYFNFMAQSTAVGVTAKLDIDIKLADGVTANIAFVNVTNAALIASVATITESGQHTLEYANESAPGRFVVYLTGESAEYNYIHTFTVSYFNDEISCYEIKVKNSIGEVVIAPNTIYPTIADNGNSIYSIDWNDAFVADGSGCYSICIDGAPAQNNVLTEGDNGTFENYIFDNDDMWSDFQASVTSALSYAGQKSLLVQLPENEDGILISAVPDIERFKNYRLKAQVYIDADYQVQDAYVAIVVYDGTALDYNTIEPQAVKLWQEVYVDFYSEDENSVYFEIIASGTDWQGVTNIYIDNIEIIDLDNDNETECSQCFLLAEKHPCSLLLEWWNDNDAYGFSYSNDFKHSMRVMGSLAKPTYSGEKEIFKDTDGVKKVVWADKEKTLELAINDLPAYMHDALAIAIDHDHFAINGVEYIVEEAGYEPQWRKTSDLAPIILDVKPKTQNLTNSYC